MGKYGHHEAREFYGSTVWVSGIGYVSKIEPSYLYKMAKFCLLKIVKPISSISRNLKNDIFLSMVFNNSSENFRRIGIHTKSVTEKHSHRFL